MFGHRQSGHDDRYEQGFEWFSILIRIFTSETSVRSSRTILRAEAGDRRAQADAAAAPGNAVGRVLAGRPSLRRRHQRFPVHVVAQLRKRQTPYRGNPPPRRRSGARGRGPDDVACRVSGNRRRGGSNTTGSTRKRWPTAAAVEFHQRKKDAHYGAVEPDAVKIERKRYAGGTGSYPLIGSPQRIAEEIVRMHQLGLSGATISFVNFNEELPFFVERVMPLLQQAGLRSGNGVRSVRGRADCRAHGTLRRERSMRIASLALAMLSMLASVADERSRHLSQPGHPHGRAVSGRRHVGCPGARAGEEDGRQHGAKHHHREHRRRGRNDRREQCGAGGAGRLHLDLRLCDAIHHRTRALSKSELRSDRIVHADRHCRPVPLPHDGLLGRCRSTAWPSWCRTPRPIPES